MKLVSYLEDNFYRLGLLLDGQVYGLHELDAHIPLDMRTFLNEGEEAMQRARHIEAQLKAGDLHAHAVEHPVITAPVPHPISCRDGYAFRQHVAAARRNRRVDMIPEFDQYPIFYFTNHNAITGPGTVTFMPDHFQKLDFELEAAIVIGKKGRNVHAADADAYIAGYMVMNDWSARTLQMEEMVLNLGPAKGKDFSTSIGPYLATPDELAPFLAPAKPGHTGNTHNLEMVCRVNGQEMSRGNLADMDWTFAEIIERCAYGVNIYPGDVIGSGTVGTGCLLELNGTGLLNNPAYTPYWLKPGDVVEMEIERLGTLSNTVAKEATDFSLLALKKLGGAA